MVQNLFDKYMQEGKISEALLVGQNMFNKDSGNTEIFKKYVGVLLKLASDYHAPIAVCSNYCDKAELAIEFYAENTELTEAVIAEIIKKRNYIYEIRLGLDAREKEESREFFNKKIEENDKTLEFLLKLKHRLGKVTQKAEFDKVLGQIQQLDEVLDKEYLTEHQETEYQKISRECAGLVDIKMRYFNHKNNVEYNLRALEIYERAYKGLKDAENLEYCHETLKDFFAFDASRLFNETLVYYNHVYSYILSKMDDKGKFNMTKLAIQCEKKYMNAK